VSYIPCLINIGSGIQKLVREELQTQHGDLISLLLNFKPRVKTVVYYESHSKNVDSMSSIENADGRDSNHCTLKD
jgi:hypothetical protein